MEEKSPYMCAVGFKSYSLVSIVGIWTNNYCTDLKWAIGLFEWQWKRKYFFLDKDVNW